MFVFAYFMAKNVSNKEHFTAFHHIYHNRKIDSTHTLHTAVHKHNQCINLLAHIRVCVCVC